MDTLFCVVRRWTVNLTGACGERLFSVVGPTLCDVKVFSDLVVIVLFELATGAIYVMKIFVVFVVMYSKTRGNSVLVLPFFYCQCQSAY